VVIYASAGHSHVSATYLAWILLGFGHPEILVLEGGYEQWFKEGRPVSRTYPDIQLGIFPSSPSTLQRARLPQVRWIVDQKMGVLVDARSKEQYDGTEGPQMRRGHVPGAINHFWKSDLVESESGTVWKTLEELRTSYVRQGITPERRIVVYCNSGAEASHVFFSLYCLLKYPNVRVYVPSYTEWAENEELPVETAR
jgi:thiosulfate/3-mercaptopyruvate sulfurtransferase